MTEAELRQARRLLGKLRRLDNVKIMASDVDDDAKAHPWIHVHANDSADTSTWSSGDQFTITTKADRRDVLRAVAKIRARAARRLEKLGVTPPEPA